MQQQINLYLLLPEKPRFQLTLPITLYAYGVFALVLLSIFIAEWWQSTQLLREYTRLNNQVMTQQQQFTALSQQYPISDITNLKSAVENLQKQVDSKLKIVNILTATADFSAYLSGLASVDVPDLWLTEITFNNLEHSINLKGLALHTDLVERLMEQLDKQKVFSELKFALQNVTESTSPPGFQILAKQEQPS